MARSPKTVSRRGSRIQMPSTILLALLQLRKTWRMFLVIEVGILAAVVIACIVPLYSSVTMSVGLHGALTASAQNGDIVVSGASEKISFPLIDSISHHLQQKFDGYFGPYLDPSGRSLQTPDEPVLTGKPGNLSETLNLMHVVGFPMDQATAHLKLVKGRLPQTNSNNLEIAVTSETASAMKVSIGSIVYTPIAFVQIPVARVVRNLALHVVGIFTNASPSDPFWHGDIFAIQDRGVNANIYTGLVSYESFLSSITQITNDPTLNTDELPRLVLEVPFALNWYYHLDPGRITIDDLNTIAQNLNNVLIDISDDPNLSQGAFLQGVQAYVPSSIFEQYRSRIEVVRIPVFSLLCLVLGLVLFFVSVMANLLIDRHSEAIAILRSRGASRHQIFGSLVTLSVVLGLVALIVGPFIALLAVRSITRSTVSAADQSIVSTILRNPLSVVLGMGWFALGATAAAILALIIAISRAARLDVLAMRRETARSTRRPLWERLNLDIVAAIIMLVGYGVAYYVTSSDVLDVQVRLLLLTPLRVVGAAFLFIACMLLFLRFFPLLLRLGAKLAMRSRGASPMLALAQMARAPRQSIRMTLLLAFATAFAIFSLIFAASQNQHILDVSLYQGSADFSGTIASGPIPGVELQERTALYDRIPGVTSATLGYATPATTEGSVTIPIDLRAVDGNTYAQTAIWATQDSSQSLSTLMQKLVAQRSVAIQQGVVPAIVDAATWDSLHLDANPNFTLDFSTGTLTGSAKFIAVARVQNIPTVNDSTVTTNTNDYVAAGGMLVDFQTYRTVFVNDYFLDIPLDFVWLRTHNDAKSLASVRSELTTGVMSLNPLFDRRATIAALYTEPLYLTLIGLLAFGATTALLLALMGNLIASWLSARSRLTSFAVLRALGTSPPQIASVLTWEQTIIYSTAIVLGVIFGLVLSLLVVPVLVFTSVAPTSNVSSGQFLVMQSIPPVQIVIPPTVGIALIVLIAICVIALGIMVRTVSRPSIGQAIRLNED